MTKAYYYWIESLLLALAQDIPRFTQASAKAMRKHRAALRSTSPVDGMANLLRQPLNQSISGLGIPYESENHAVGITVKHEADISSRNPDQGFRSSDVTGADELATFNLIFSPRPGQATLYNPPVIEEATKPRGSIFSRSKKNCWVAIGVPVTIAGIEIVNGMRHVCFY